MLIAVFDTETTGLPDYKNPSEGPQQPHIVEIAALLYDTETSTLVEAFHAIVRPDGWEIPEETTAIHKISTAHALEVGIPEHQAVAGFLAIVERADLRVAHNESFDARILRIALKRHGDGRDAWATMHQDERDVIADAFKERPKFCTMKSMIKVCALPKNKWPKLAEAYLTATGLAMGDEAHSALDDAKACAAVYFFLLHAGEIA